MIRKTLNAIRASAMSSVKLSKVDMDGMAPEAALDLAFLPPSHFGRLSGTEQSIFSRSVCEQQILVTKDSNGNRIEKKICGTPQNYKDLIKDELTEMRAMVNIPTPIFGSVKKEISASGFLDPTPSASQPIVVPPTPSDPPGLIVGSYTITGQDTIHGGQNGPGAGYNVKSEGWGKVSVISKPSYSKGAGTLRLHRCDPGYDTIWLSATASDQLGGVPIAPGAAKRFGDDWSWEGGYLPAPQQLVFLCVTR